MKHEQHYLMTIKGPIHWGEEQHNKLLAENSEEGFTITNENKHEIYENLIKLTQSNS